MKISEELNQYPNIKDGKYSEELWGKLFKVKNFIAYYYCQEDGRMIWYVPNEKIPYYSCGKAKNDQAG